MNVITILLVDGRKLLRAGLRMQLQEHRDIRVVGEAEDLQAVTKLVAALRPQVVVMTASPDGHRWVQRVRAVATGGSRLLALLLKDDPHFVREALDAGAAGCLTRDAAIDELLVAIRKVASGGVYLSQGLVHDVALGAVLGVGRDSRLSEREVDVLRRIADGDNTKMIAIALAVSGKTVETYRRRIMEKLGKYSLAELVKYAVREGIASVDENSAVDQNSI
jgi:DNA-binding NarL/FixJ family response regulator